MCKCCKKIEVSPTTKSQLCRKCAAQKTARNPEWIAKNKAVPQKRAQNPQYKENCRKGYEIRNQNQKFTKMLTERNIAMAQDPIHLEKVTLAAQKRSAENEGWKTHNKEAMQKRVLDPKNLLQLVTAGRISGQKRLGTKISEEDSIKLSMAQQGIKDRSEWKGFITPLQTQIRDCDKMIEWRNAVFKRDNYKDHDSGCSPTHKNRLEAHHIVPFHKLLKKYNITTIEQALRCAPLWDPNNGKTMLHYSHVAYHNMWGKDYE